MKSHQATVFDLHEQSELSVLDQIIREGAQRLLQIAIAAEVDEYITRHEHLRDSEGRRLVVRNGKSRARSIQTGAGALTIRQPRVNDRREDIKFVSALLPPYLRRSKNIEALVPALYLKGVSTNAMQEALRALLGPAARGLSAPVITRMKEHWQEEYEEWMHRSLEGKEYVYIWVDGIYSKVRLSDERPCCLVVIGADSQGNKELLAVVDGERESKLSWKELLLNLKKRGLTTAPRLCIADGALGFWTAIEEVWPGSKPQRCWVHKTANVLDKLPKSLQESAKRHLHRIYHGDTRQEAERECRDFVSVYQAKHPKAVKSLTSDLEELLSFYDFPAEHWQSIRSTNVIESTFATIRHRSRQTKGSGTRLATLTLIYKLGREAEKGWRRLRGYQYLPKVAAGKRFKDGIEMLDKKSAA